MELREGKKTDNMRQTQRIMHDLQLVVCGRFAKHGLLACFNDKHCLILTKESKPTVFASNLIRDHNSKLYFMSFTSKPVIKDIKVLLTKQSRTISTLAHTPRPPHIQEPSANGPQQLNGWVTKNTISSNNL